MGPTGTRVELALMGSLDCIRELLLSNRAEGTDWGELSQLGNEPCSKQLANKFLLCCLLDYQMHSDLAWANGERLVSHILNDPDDIWKAITSASEDEWKGKRAEYSLHRYPAGHHRLWNIARKICSYYGGDARRIWEGKNPQAALEALRDLGAGEQLSRMIVGALRDCGQIKTQGSSDVKADVYVCRVLGRVVQGKTVEPEAAVGLARQIYPADPWQLDAALWQVGNRVCKLRNPLCSECYLAVCCAYDALSKRLLSLVKFLDPMRVEGFEFGTWVPPGKEGPVHTMPYNYLSATAAAFVQATYDNGWIRTDFNWAEWSSTDEARQLQDNAASLENASVDQLANLLTLLVRQDRFCEGLLSSAYESGLITRILCRADSLYRELDGNSGI